MDCRICQPSLIDLFHGELAIEAAEQARAHIAHCANCNGALDKLARGLAPRSSCRCSTRRKRSRRVCSSWPTEQARRSAAQRKPRVAPTAWQALLDFIGRFATARQVGMVTIMLLIVAVGLWSLPQLKHTPVAAGGTVVHPDESGEAAPTPGCEPAQPLDLKVDLRAGRIRSTRGPRHGAAAAAATRERPWRRPSRLSKALRSQSARFGRVLPQRRTKTKSSRAPVADSRARARATSERKPVSALTRSVPPQQAAKGSRIAHAASWTPLLDGRTRRRQLEHCNREARHACGVCGACSARQAGRRRRFARNRSCGRRQRGRRQRRRARRAARRHKPIRARRLRAQRQPAVDATPRFPNTIVGPRRARVRRCRRGVDRDGALRASAWRCAARSHAAQRAARIPQVAGRALGHAGTGAASRKAEAEAAPAELPSGAKP